MGPVRYGEKTNSGQGWKLACLAGLLLHIHIYIHSIAEWKHTMTKSEESLVKSVMELLVAEGINIELAAAFAEFMQYGARCSGHTDGLKKTLDAMVPPIASVTLAMGGRETMDVTEKVKELTGIFIKLDSMLAAITERIKDSSLQFIAASKEALGDE
jgi:hypothetical protein